jgi:hypothetical protein
MIEIDFSATTYFQAKDRMTIKERLENNVFWVFAKNTIEYDIYKRVIQKKHYTTSNFIKDNGVKISNQSNSGISNARLSVFKNY